MDYRDMPDRAVLLMLADRTERIEDLLLGNGQPGVVARLAGVESDIDALSRSRDERTPLVGEFRALQEQVRSIDRMVLRGGAVGGLSGGALLAIVVAVLTKLGVQI